VKQRLVRLSLLLAVLLIVAGGAAVLLLRSDWFREKVRQRIVSELARATGGEVTVAQLTLEWQALWVEVRDVVIRGKEPASEAPLLRLRSARLGLQLLSVFKPGVDLNSLVIEEPVVNLIVYPDGTTNLPAPKVKGPAGNVAETILDLAVKQFSIERGVIQVAARRFPLEANGRDLAAHFIYEDSGPRYRGRLSVKPLSVGYASLPRQQVEVDLALGFEKNRLEVSSARLAVEGSRLEGSGGLVDFSAPKARAQFRAEVSLAQVSRLARLPWLRQGDLSLHGTARYDGAYSVAAQMEARGVDVRDARLQVSGIHLTSAVEITAGAVKCESLRLAALGGRFAGRAEIRDWRRLVVDGEAHEFSIPKVVEAAGGASATWSAHAAGPVHLETVLGTADLTAEVRLALAPSGGGIPLNGYLEARFDRRRGTLDLGQSWFATPASRLEASGRLGQQMRVRAESKDLDDLQPLLGGNSLPVRLDHGSAAFDGTVTGRLEAPRIAGQVTLERFIASGEPFDRLTAAIAATQSSLRVDRATLARGRAQAQLEGSVDLVDWKTTPSGAVRGVATVRDVGLADWLHDARGLLAATARVSGTVGDPRVEAEVAVVNATMYEEAIDRVQARLAYSGKVLALREAQITAGPARLKAQGTFRGDWAGGQIQFEAATNEMPVERLAAARRLRENLAGKLRIEARGAAQFKRAGDRPPEIMLTSIDGDAFARDLTLDGKPAGSVALTARTTGNRVDFRLRSDLLKAAVEGGGTWRLEPGYPAQGEIAFSKLSLAAARDWFAPPSDFHFDGTVEGKLALSGSALEPAKWKAALEVARLEWFPRLDQAGNSAGLFTLRNDGLITGTLEGSTLRVTRARLVGPSTQLAVEGTASLQSKGAVDLRVTGGLNLAILKDLTADFSAAGAVAVNAQVRGPLANPQVHGRIEFQEASFNVADVPAGLTSATGLILFTGDRATIQSLSAEVGGGKITATGFLGFAAGEISYRLQANAAQVRVRYPEGVSTSVNAALTLSGTTRRSLLTGNVTILRTGFNQRTDLSAILSKSVEPVRTPSTRSGPLGGLQFDIAVDTAPNLAFESALAQDIQAEASLRLRGTPFNPVLLGRISVTQGEITFFGTKYAINQGTIDFINPVKLEPILNLDLETKVRGVDVILTFAGPLNKLTVTHRADPPLEFAEVVALLAAGRTPTSDPSLVARQAQAQPQSFTQLGATALVGQAFATPLSNRLQRFFGVSRLKIDPTLVGVENRTQARVTLEQQVSKNLTFTYITDVTRSNPQIVRVEWALTKEFSVLATREETGLFGLDFLYKRSFK